MPSAQEWIRVSQRTPGILIFGMVLAPCGWILDLTATVAPNWRTLHQVEGRANDLIVQQGIFDICAAESTSTDQNCDEVDTVYFTNDLIPIAQGLMVASLVVTLIGLAVAIPGVRCWKEKPNWVVAGLGGILIFISGVLTIIPIAWYTHILTDLTTELATDSVSTDVRVGFCIVLGYIGGIFEILGGFVMFIGICRCCGGKNRGERRVDEVFPPQRPPTLEVPSLNRVRTPTPSVPYSKDSLDDDVSFPRAKTPPTRGPQINHAFNGRPYDADL